MAQVDTLAFETTEEVFCNGVVVGVALTGHTLAEMKVEQTLTVRLAAYWTPRLEWKMRLG